MLAAAGLFASAAPIRPNESDTRRLPHSGGQQSAPAKPRPRLFKANYPGLRIARSRRMAEAVNIMYMLRIAESSVVADLGAGSGWFTIQLGAASDPTASFTPKTSNRRWSITSNNARSATTCAASGRSLALRPTRCFRLGVDAILIPTTLSDELDDWNVLQECVEVAEAWRTTRRGRFLSGGGGPGPAPEDDDRSKAVIAAAEAAGLNLQKRGDIRPSWSCSYLERR